MAEILNYIGLVKIGDKHPSKEGYSVAAIKAGKKGVTGGKDFFFYTPSAVEITYHDQENDNYLTQTVQQAYPKEEIRAAIDRTKKHIKEDSIDSMVFLMEGAVIDDDSGPFVVSIIEEHPYGAHRNRYESYGNPWSVIVRLNQDKSERPLSHSESIISVQYKNGSMISLSKQEASEHLEALVNLIVRQDEQSEIDRRNYAAFMKEKQAGCDDSQITGWRYL